MIRWRVLLTAALVLAPVAGQAAGSDVTGSRDPEGLERFPRSWIVDYDRDEEVRQRELITGRVDRVRRDMQIDDRLRVDGTLETATYRIPDGVGVDEVVAHYVDAMNGGVLFRCEGRGCGRSNDWANQIFEQAILYGPDRNQRYLVLEWQDRLVSLYVIERGNQRVYAHLRVVESQGGVGLEPNALLVRRLSERGWAVIEAVTPQPDGAIDAAGQRLLSDLGGSLDDFSGRTIYLVCHLGGIGGPALAASERCAAEAAAVLSGDGESPGASLRVESFGAGALLPRPNLPPARLELVLPGNP